MKKFNKFLALSFALVAAGGVQAARAASSDWQDIDAGKARIVALADPADGTISGAVELQLDDGWKTYWRTPGSSGIPPRFDFSQSEGVTIDTVSWPAPHRIDINGDIISGYTRYVAFPFEAKTPSNGTGKLQLSLLMGLCKSVCIPVTTTLSLPLEQLNGSNFRDLNVLEKARQTLPKMNDNAVRVAAMTLAGDNRISARISLPDEGVSAGDIQLFVEDGKKSWFEPVVAQSVEQNGDGMATASFEIPYRLAVKGQEIPESPLVLTLRVGQKSFELSHKIK